MAPEAKCGKAFPPQMYPMKASSGSVSDSSEFDKYEGKFFAEEKLDGTHITVIKKGNEIALMTRSWKNNHAQDYPEIVLELQSIKVDCVLNGELVFYDKDGKPKFLASTAKDAAVGLKPRLMLFDVLEFDGHNMRNQPQVERSHFVDAIVKTSLGNGVGHIPPVESGFKALFDKVVASGGEGLMLKKKDGIYQDDKRSSGWVKMKREETHDCFVLGLQDSTEGKYMSSFGALVLGQFVDGKLQIVARSSGLTDAMRAELNTKIRALPKDTSLPADLWKGANGKDVNHKIAPDQIVVEIKCMERYGKTALMRMPRFVKVRTDKLWKDCTYDSAVAGSE